MNGPTRHGRSAGGWVATTLGGVVGAVLLCLAAFIAADAYFDRRPSEGLEELGWVLTGGAVGLCVGAAAGGAIALKVRGYRRPVVSGVLFSTLASLSLLGWALLVGRFFEEWDEPVVLLIPIVTVVPGSAWLARWLLFASDRGAGSAPPE